jgi:hypothetical protein
MLNKAEIAIGLIILAAACGVIIYHSTPGLGKPWNPNAPACDSIKYLEGMWYCWIPGTHCIAVNYPPPVPIPHQPTNNNNTTTTTTNNSGYNGGALGHRTR